MSFCLYVFYLSIFANLGIKTGNFFFLKYENIQEHTSLDMREMSPWVISPLEVIYTYQRMRI